MPNDDHQFTTEEILYRIVAPAASVLWAVTQLDGATALGRWFLALVIVVGLFLTFQQSIEAADRRLNIELYEKGIG